MCQDSLSKLNCNIVSRRGVESTPPHKKSKKLGLNRVKVSKIKGKVNQQARGIISGRKKARFSVAYLIGYRPLVNQFDMQQTFFSLHLAQLEFVGNPGFCH